MIDDDDELYEDITQHFVINIWLEGKLDPGEKNPWRGHITHIPDGKRQAFENLLEVIFFIIPYLENMGARPGAGWQALNWLRSWKKRRPRRKAALKDRLDNR